MIAWFRRSRAVPVVNCPNCHTQVAPGFPFCSRCGHRLPVPAGTIVCRNCGAPSASDANFCPACGRALSRSSSGRSALLARVSLVSLDESGEELQRFGLAGDETTIGREDADICFPDDVYLSPLHAQVGMDDGELVVRDLGSRNGTWYFLTEPYRLVDGDLLLIGSQILRFRRLGYPGPHPPERDATRRMGSLVPSTDIASLTQLRADGSARDVIHLSPGRHVTIGRDQGDWIFPYDPSMSGTHAQVRSEDADFVLLDAGSRNGVAVAVRGEMPLKNGIRLLVGSKMLRVEIA